MKRKQLWNVSIARKLLSLHMMKKHFLLILIHLIGELFLSVDYGGSGMEVGYALTVCSLGLISRNFFLSIICTPIIFALGLFYGFKGNKISWSQKDWPSIESFEQSQTRWCMAGWIVIVLISIFELVIMYPN